MTFDPTRHHRRSIRLPGHQYSDNGAYYITIRTVGRSHSLGRIEGTSVSMSAEGVIVDERWRAIPGHHTGVSIDAWVVMPDHVHGVLMSTEETRPHRSRQMQWVNTIRADQHRAP